MLIPHGFVIAIDGPVASGKGTVAAALAEKLGGFFMNTGGMYRAVALYCINSGIDVNNEAEAKRVLPEANIDIRGGKIFLNDDDVTERITELDTSRGSSVVAVYGSVREALVAKQQEIGQRVITQNQIVIAEGRDAGTTIFPTAKLRMFLTAGVEVRARRRQIQEQASGKNRELSEIIEDIEIRDRRDKGRVLSPLSSDPGKDGYWILDNSEQNSEQTIETIVEKLKEEGLIEDDQN
jgi:cytidylate kinase